MTTQGIRVDEGTTETGRRRRPTWLRAVSGTLVAVLVVVVTILAVRADGQPVHDVALTDGSIWVSGGRTGDWARVNTGAHGFDLVVQEADPAAADTAAARPDVLQDGRNAVGVTSDLRLVAIDSRTGEPIDGVVQVPPPTYVTGVDFHRPGLVAMHGNTLAVVDQTTGRVWAKRLDPKGGTPIGDLRDTGGLATVGPNAAVTVDLDGDVMAVSADTGTVVEIPAEGAGFGSPERTDLGFTGGRAADITAVGDTWVVLDLEKGEVHVEGRDGAQPLPGESQQTAGVTLAMATLQQPGPSRDVVAFQTRERAGYLPITDASGQGITSAGVVSGLSTDERTVRRQRISSPAVNGDCLYAAWGDGAAVRWGSACGTQEAPAGELTSSGSLSRRYGVAVRHNRGQLLLNDLDTGDVYDLSLTGDLRIDTWPASVSPPKRTTPPKKTTKPTRSTAKKSTKTSTKKSTAKTTKTSG